MELNTSTEFIKKKYFYHKITISLGILIGFIISEFFFRNPLFNKSVELIEDFQSKTGKGFENFMKLISKCGFAVFIFVLIGYFIFPLTKQYPYIFTCILSFYINNILKIFYRNPRPFFENDLILKECDGGFGNPSGHAMLSSCSYLSFCQLLCEEFNFNFIIRFILYFVFSLIILLIGISRLYLAVHSINQILYGFILGFACYYFVFNIFYLQRKSPTLFFNEFKTNINKIIITISLIIFTSFLFIFGYTLHFNREFYNSIVNCDLKKERIFLKDGIFLGLIIVSLLGFHYGFVLISYYSEKYKGKEKYINYFMVDLNKNLLGLFVLFIFLIIGYLPLILFIILKNVSIPIAYIFKMVIPSTLCLFLNYGVFIIIFIKFKFANKNIYYLENEIVQIKSDKNNV
jgi:membrane-associated phospholipid phosphatase